MKFFDFFSAKTYKIIKSNFVLKTLSRYIRNHLSKATSAVSVLRSQSKMYPVVTELIPSVYDWVNEESNSLKPAFQFVQITDDAKVYKKNPVTIDCSINWKFENNLEGFTPKTFVLFIPNGRVWKDLAVISSSNRLVYDVCKTMKRTQHFSHTDCLHPVFTEKKMPPAKYIDSTVAVLAFPYSATNYYHFMLDSLPRIRLLELANLSYDDIDYFLISGYNSSFHHEAIAKVGISKKKILTTQWHLHIEAKKLIVPSLVGDTGQFPKWSICYLQSKFWPERASKNCRRLYLNRRKVAYRRVINELEIEAFLSEFGFESISLEDYSVTQQASMMYDAAAVIAPHGAGLTNIAFCRPGTKVIELMHYQAINLMYWNISNTIDLQYAYLLSEGVASDRRSDRHDNFEDMRFDIKKLDELMKRVECLVD